MSIQQACICSRHLCSWPRNPLEGLAVKRSHTDSAGDETVKLTRGLHAQEFHPYVFQIFAQLIELRPAPLPAVYMSIFKPLLAPLFWERPGNVPALTRLLQAYCSKAMAEIMQQGHLEVDLPFMSQYLWKPDAALIEFPAKVCPGGVALLHSDHKIEPPTD